LVFNHIFERIETMLKIMMYRLLTSVMSGVMARTFSNYINKKNNPNIFKAQKH